jgi:hypothetical protein
MFDLYDRPRSAQRRFVSLTGSTFNPVTWPLVEVKGFEPSASTLRMCGSQPFDQVLSEGLPYSGVAIPSGSLTIPPLPSR